MSCEGGFFCCFVFVALQGAAVQLSGFAFEVFELLDLGGARGDFGTNERVVLVARPEVLLQALQGEGLAADSLSGGGLALEVRGAGEAAVEGVALADCCLKGGALLIAGGLRGVQPRPGVGALVQEISEARALGEQEAAELEVETAGHGVGPGAGLSGGGAAA